MLNMGSGIFPPLFLGILLLSRPVVSQNPGVGTEPVSVPKVICVHHEQPTAVCMNLLTNESDYITGHDVEAARRIFLIIGWLEDQDYVFQCMHRVNITNALLDDSDATCFAAVGAMVANTTLYAQGMKFSHPIFRGYLALLTFSSAHRGSLWSFLVPYDWTLWIAIVLTIFTLPILLWVFETWERGKEVRSSWPKLFTLGWQSIGIFLGIDTVVVTSIPSRLVSLAYSFLILILIATVG
jgi:hypothetical protein